jgi:hypothetical protein
VGEIKDMLLKTYLKQNAKKAPAKGEPKVDLAKPPKPIKVERPKTVGDISISMRAQKIYSPGGPPVPPMKPPNNAMMDHGTAASMNLDTSYLGKK